MPGAKPNPVVRVLPSLTDVAALMPLLFLFARMNGALTMLSDCDTGWHIRTGEWILANGWVPDRDIFSFTKPGQPWFAWEWLWDVLFAKVHQLGGLPLVVLINISLIALTFALLFRLVSRKCGNVLIAAPITMLAAVGSCVHFLARPHLVTWLFLVIFYCMLERVREAHVAGTLRIRPLIAMPLLTVLWTNLHGGFFVGAVLIGAYGLGEIAGVAFATDSAERRSGLRRGVPYILSACGCFAASFVNPYFYRLHVHIWSYLTDSYQWAHIDEFLSLSFHNPAARFLEPMVVLAGVAIFWNICRKRFAYAILLALWVHLGLMSARNIPILMIVASPIVALSLHEMLLRMTKEDQLGWLRRAALRLESSPSAFGATDRIPRLHLVTAGMIGLIGVLLYSPAAPPKFHAEFNPKSYPQKALQYMTKSGYAGRVFTHDEWGDYLIYTLYPHSKVFVDGRSDFYGAKFEQKYLDVMNVKYDWEHNLRQYGVDTILLPADAYLAGALKESSRWRAVYDDGLAIVFRPAASRPASEQVSAAQPSSGKGRDREITKYEPRDPAITKSDCKT